jgi:hypothetical protein
MRHNVGTMERYAQLRRQMAMASALGSKPSGYAPMPAVLWFAALQNPSTGT